MQSTEDNTAATSQPKSKRSVFFTTLAVLGISILAFVVLPTVNSFRALQRKACRSRIYAIGYATRSYANEHNGYLPPADKWHDILVSEYNCNPKFLVCPSAKGDKRTYAININVAGKKLDEIPKDTVMIFEIEGNSNVYGGPELLVARHGRTIFEKEACIVFTDGHQKVIKSKDFDTLKWKPEQEN